jgi:hypothetical protein
MDLVGNQPRDRRDCGGWRLRRERKQPHASCGLHFQLFTVNVRSTTRISGKRMQPFCRQSATELLARRVVRPATSSASTRPCASAVADWFARRSRSRKRRPITSARFGTTSTTITHDNAPNSSPLPVHDYRGGECRSLKYDEYGVLGITESEDVTFCNRTVYRLCIFDVFSPTASRMSAFRAASSTVSPSWKSMARTVLLSKRVLKSFFGSFS